MMNHKKPAALAALIYMISLPGQALAQENLIEASKFVNSNISNGLDIVGQVDDLILNESGTAVQYVLFNVSETFQPTSSEKGFIDIDNVDFGPGDWGSRREVIVEDTDAQRSPQELELTRHEADHRLLSNVLEQFVHFSNDEVRKIDDVLINPDNGEIEYFTVEMSTDSFFDPDVRAIPLDELDIDRSGRVSTSVSLSDLDSGNKYQLGSL